MSQSQHVAFGGAVSTQPQAAAKPTPARPKRVYRPMGVPYQLASGLWAIRARHREQTFCLSGFAEKSQARQALLRQLQELDEGQCLKPETVALALQQYGLAHLPRLRGAPQEARIINTYLRAAGERTIRVCMAPTAVARYQKTHHAVVSLVASPAGQDAAQQGSGPDIQVTGAARLRAALAGTRMDRVTSGQIHALLQTLEDEGRARETVLKERGLLARLFNYALRFGGKSSSTSNPVTDVRLFGHGRRRTRLMSASERERMEDAFTKTGGADLARMFVFLSESGIDAKYCAEQACWDEVLWGHRAFCRRGSHNPSSLVLLSDRAMGILHEMRPAAGPSPQIFGTSYASFQRAWQRVRRSAGVEDLRIQDLRQGIRFGWNFVMKPALFEPYADDRRESRQSLVTRNGDGARLT